MRRGWVTPMRLVSPRPMASAILGSCVVFPEPVAPATMTTGWSWIAVAMSTTRAEIGSSGGNAMGERGSGSGIAGGPSGMEGLGISTPGRSALVGEDLGVHHVGGAAGGVGEDRVEHVGELQLARLAQG